MLNVWANRLLTLNGIMPARFFAPATVRMFSITQLPGRSFMAAKRKPITIYDMPPFFNVRANKSVMPIIYLPGHLFALANLLLTPRNLMPAHPFSRDHPVSDTLARAVSAPFTRGHAWTVPHDGIASHLLALANRTVLSIGGMPERPLRRATLQLISTSCLPATLLPEVHYQLVHHYLDDNRHPTQGDKS